VKTADEQIACSKCEGMTEGWCDGNLGCTEPSDAWERWSDGPGCALPAILIVSGLLVSAAFIYGLYRLIF
jgi:hypothetical protein